MKLLFASNNKNKILEIRKKITNKNITLLSLSDVNFYGDIPETSNTIKGNSLQKAKFINDKYKIDCFSDDTGLEVKSLNGNPGVFSARYAGENSSSNDNMEKLLLEMKGKENRIARFRTIITLILNNDTHIFEGVVEGKIATKKSGEKGFGYDPIFIPKGYNKTFAEIGIEEKNKISHRAIAINKLIIFLNNKNIITFSEK